jgi:uncharacterized protein YbjT (DUF2867 family)
VARLASVALTRPGVARNTAWTPTGPEALTYEEVAEILSEVLGRPIPLRSRVFSATPDMRACALGMAWGMVAVTTATYTIARPGRAGGLTDDVQRITGQSPTSLSAFADREKSIWPR